jgi:hypothetical protein
MQLDALLADIRACRGCEASLPFGHNPVLRAWREYLPEFLPLPHPSPRNQMWLKRNPWFEQEVLTELRSRVADVLD